MLEWQIRQETGSPSGDSASHEPSEDKTGWESRLKLSLPKLGTVEVYIKLDAQQAFSIRMVPEQPETAPLLQANHARLVEQLTTAGCELHAVTVQNDAKP
ncbi:MAG: flagellar hook-length control protein FliK [Gammaproteobacteria bacterium]